MEKKMNKMDLQRYAKFLKEKYMDIDVNDFGGFRTFIKNYLLADHPMDDNWEDELEVFIDTKFHGTDSSDSQYVELLLQVDAVLIGSIYVYANEDGEIYDIETA